MRVRNLKLLMSYLGEFKRDFILGVLFIAV